MARGCRRIWARQQNFTKKRLLKETLAARLISTLTSWPTVYLVVFVNLNQDDAIDLHEDECLILDFGN
jgi:hypothetical protein